MRSFFKLFIFFILLALAVPLCTRADSASSTNFTIQGGVMNGGGGLATSTNFGVQGSVGQDGAGVATSTSFVVSGGFLYSSAPTVSVTPNAPSNLVAVPISSTEVDLTWTSNSGGSEDGFRVERKTGVGGTYAQIGTVGTGVAAYADTSASPSTTYFYRVRAFIGSNYSSYSNESSVTTSASSGGGGGGSSGGGGGGGTASGGSATPAISTVVNVSGAAYPLSTVVVLQDGQTALQTIAGPDGNFSASLTNLTAGSYIFSVYGEDSAGRRSATFNFPVTITAGATTNISGIFLSPTIGLDKTTVKKGDTLTIFGEAVPSAPVTIQVDSAGPVFLNTTSSANGAYLYEMNTANLELGSHVAKSEAASGNVVSDYSLAAGFTVGSENISAPTQSACPPNYQLADLNKDCRVNLVDFSILAYWWHRPNPPVGYLISGGTGVSLKDFSIMAYEWTG